MKRYKRYEEKIVSISVSWAEPLDKVHFKLNSRYGINNSTDFRGEIIEKNGPGGWPIVKFTGEEKSLKKSLKKLGFEEIDLK
jgi:hypothetical protein